MVFASKKEREGRTYFWFMVIDVSVEAWKPNHVGITDLDYIYMHFWCFYWEWFILLLNHPEIGEKEILFKCRQEFSKPSSKLAKDNFSRNQEINPWIHGTISKHKMTLIFWERKEKSPHHCRPTPSRRWEEI